MELKSSYFILIQLISVITETLNRSLILEVHDVSSTKQIINWPLFTSAYKRYENLNPITEIIFDQISFQENVA